MSDDPSMKQKTVKELAGLFNVVVEVRAQPQAPRRPAVRQPPLPQPVRVEPQPQPRPQPQPHVQVQPEPIIVPVQPIPVLPVLAQPVLAQPVLAQPVPVQISKVALIKKQQEEAAKHECLSMLSEGLQNKKVLDKLPFLDGSMTPLQKTMKVNMALAGHVEGVSKTDLLNTLAPKANAGAAKAVLDEFGSMANIDVSVNPERVEAATQVFSKFTKEGYENVTGFARGGTRFDKALGRDRPMTEPEKEDGKATLKGLTENWPTMPKFTGTTVFRVLHAGTGEDSLSQGGSLVKANPTSSSVATDWSRVGDGKVCCKLTIVPSTDEMRPVDTRGVSTYAHEGEILLPPGTSFTKTGVDGNFTTFDARMP